MVNSGSFDSDGQGDRNAKVGCTQPHNASDSTQSSSPVTASAAAPCKTDFSQTADSDLPSVAHAIEPTPTKTEFNCDMPVENFTNLSSVDGAVEERENPPVSGSEDEKTSLCCSLPLDKVQGVLTPYHPSATKADDDGTKVKQPTRKLLCLYCDRSFVSANLRQKHVERIHSVKQNRRFSSRRQNQLTVTPCVYCDKINGTENTLKDLFQHLINEHSGKYFGCLPCEDRFLTSSLLVDHNASKHNYSVPQTSNKLETPAGANKTTLKVPKPDDVKVESEEEETEEVPVKLTRSRMRLKPQEEGGKSKKAIVGNKKKSTKLKEMRTKKLSVKSSRIALKRRESKRLQAIAKIADSQNKKRPKPGTEKKQSSISKLEQTNSTKSTEKAKSNSTCINPYPEFDHFYRVKKITDHSIDNLKISSLTFDDVFDKAFFNRIKCNIEENLLHHIDGKLFKNEESESRISNFEKISNVPQEVQNSNSENYGCELSLNAVTPVASLSLNSQFGEDFESQIEYGSKPSKKKTQTRKDEIHYKYFTRRKYQASILEHKENRDLSKLDMWTQLVIKKRQQKMLDDKKSAKEILEYTTCDEYKNKVQREELNRILDRRGPFEDLKEEASKKAAFDKLNLVSEDSISQESFTEVREVLNEILNRVFAATDELSVEVEAATEKAAATCSNKKADLREIPAYLNLRRSSSLPSDGEIDKSDKIALICSSQETENFELPTNQVRGKNELIELTGEWARCRMYICAACGAKLPNMKYLLEHKSLYHQNVWVQHYEFVGNQSELYRHLSIPALGKVGAVEESVQCKVWRRSDARVCTKCGKQCNALGELHRHILECGGDWTWMLARKKCKYRPFGAKSRRKRRGLVHRFHHKQKTEPTEKKTYKKTFDGPRQRPSDADTIQRMLANLPAKRSTRKLISLHDGIYRARKKSQINNINQNKVKCGKVIYKSSSRKETTEKTVNTSVSVTSKKQKNKPSSNRRSLRSLNKVLASRILDTNAKLSVKRKIKVLNEQRRTRRSQLLVEELKETVIEDTSATVSVSPPPAKSKTKSAKKEEVELPEAELTTKRSSPRSSPKNVKNKMSVKKLLTGKINIKSFFPVKKRKNRKTLTENQKPESTKSEVENIDVKTRSKRKSKEIPDTEEKKKEEIIVTKVVSKKSKGETFSNLIRSLSIHKKKSTKTAAQNKTTDAKLSDGNGKKQISIKENSKISDKDEQPAKDDKKTHSDKTNKKRKLKRSFRNVINRVKKLKIENTPESTLQVEELPQNQKNATSTFLEESQPEKSVPPVQPEEIVIPSTLEAKENTADISIPAPIVMDFHEANENPPIPETIFKLESNNERSLQAKGELDFDTQKIETAATETLSAGSEAVLEYNEKTGPISIETGGLKPKIVPLVSPNMKGKIRKPVRDLNDCIAMLTSKLQQKIEDKPGDSMFSLSTPNIIKEKNPAKAECILRIPTFKSQKTYTEVEETALDLSTKSVSNADPSENQTDAEADITANDNSKIEETNEIERTLAVANTVSVDDKAQTEIADNSVDRIIEEVVGNKIQPTLQKWNSVDETIQEVVDNHHQLQLILPSRNTIDDIIDFVVEYEKDIVSDNKAALKAKKAMERPVRKIGSTRKPKNKKFVEATNNEDIDDLTPIVISSIPKEQHDNIVATTVAVEETIEKTVGNSGSNIENTSKVSVKRTVSLKKKKHLKVDNFSEIKPQNVGEKMKSNIETLDDNIESKNLPDKIDADLNKAFIETPDTAVGKMDSTKNKKASRKIGQARNRSQSKIKSSTDNKPTNKKLLETNVDTLLDVKEIDAISASPLAPQNIFVASETTMTKGEEIKQLSNEDEPHLLENKLMTSQLKTSVLQSDSEDDIPLAALVKPDESATDNKSERDVEDGVPLSKITAAFPNLLPEKTNEPNTQINSCTNSTETKPLTRVIKRRSTSIKERNENPKDNTKVAPSSLITTEDILEKNDSKVTAEHVGKSNVTKKRARSLKNTNKLKNDAADISVGEVSPEEKTIEDNAIANVDFSRKVRKRKSRSGKRTEELLTPELNEELDDKSIASSDTQEIKTSNIENQTKPVINDVNRQDCDIPVKTNIDPSNAVSPETLEVAQTSKDNQTILKMRDAGDGLIEPINENKTLVESSKNTSEDFLANSLVLKTTEILRTPKKRGRPPKNKNLPAETNTGVNKLDVNFIEGPQIQSENPDESIQNILSSAEPVAEIKKPNKRRTRSLKKKNVKSVSKEPALVSSGNSFSSHDSCIESTIKDVDRSFTEGMHMYTEHDEDLQKNISDLAEPVEETEKLDIKIKPSKTKETCIMSSSFLTENLGIEITDKEENSNLIEQTNAPEHFSNDSASAEFIAEMKKPVKRSRSKKKSLDSKSDETTLESSSASFLSEDIGIESSNEEVENYLMGPQPKFVEPEIKTSKARKRSKSVKRKNSRGESPIDSLLSDSSFNGSEVSEDFGETSTSEVKKLPRRSRSRSQKSQSPLEEEKLSNILADTPTFDVPASVLNENTVTPDNTDEVLSHNMKKRSKLVKNKVTAEIDGSSNLDITDTSLKEVSDLFRDPEKNQVNTIHEIVQVNASADGPKNKRTSKMAKSSKVDKFEMPTNSNYFLEPNCHLPDTVGETNHQAEAEFIEPIVHIKRKRSRSVRKKPILDCTDSEEETNGNFINDTRPVDCKKLDSNTGNVESVLFTDTASDCIETKKSNKRSNSLKSKSLLSKTDHLTTATDVNALLSIQITNFIEDVVEPEVKNKKGSSKLSKNAFKPEDVFVSIERVPVSTANIEDAIPDKTDIDNTPAQFSDEKVNGVNQKNNIKPKSKQKKGSLKNVHKRKNKANKIILSQLNGELLESIDLPQKVLNESNNLEEVSKFEKSKQNIFSADGIPNENCDTPIEPETEKSVDIDSTHKTEDSVESSDRKCQERPIKIIINKQKTRRKSKSFKKVDLKGQNDLFEDFALVIKKPKRIAPIVAYIPVDTFPKDMYPNYIKKPIEHPPPPVPKSAPEEIMEELTADLDASVEEMDMELDEIPITSNIIENLSFTATPPVTGLFGKADIGLLAETLITAEDENPLISPEKGNSLILPEDGNALISPENLNSLILPEKGNSLNVAKKTSELQVTKKRGRPAKNKVLKDIQIEELFQTPEKDLSSIEVEEEFLYETNKRSIRKKSSGGIVAFVQEADKKLKVSDKMSLDASFELAQDINNIEISSSVPPIGKFVDKTIESVANIFDFISGISNNDKQGANILEESSISNKKPKKLKYNNEMEVQADLEDDPTEFFELNSFVAKETETIEPFSNKTKSNRNKRKKSKSSNLDIKSTEEPVNINSNLIPNLLIDKEKDIDSIYAFTELDDLEIALPIEKPKRMPRKQTKSFSESLEHSNKDSVEDRLVDDACKADMIPIAEDIQKDFKPDIEDNIDELVPKPITKRRSRSGRDIFNENLESKEEIINTGEIKENNINIDFSENGRRKSIRSAKVKALEHIHDDALAELTESERNRDLDKDKIVPTEENLTIPDELSKNKCNRKQCKVQSAPKLTEDPEASVELTENSTLLADLVETVAQPGQYAELEMNKEKMTSTSLDESTKKSNKKNTQQGPQLLANLTEDVIGLEELEGSIERELCTTPQIEGKKRAKPAKNKTLKLTQDSALVLKEPTNETSERNDLLVEENNQELRRSRRGSRKIASYNENDLIDPLLDEIDGKRKNRKKENIEDLVTSVPPIDNKVVKKAKEPEKKLNSDELFDLLKASSKENSNIPKAPNSFLSNLDESSRDFNDENFENAFENILEKSAFLIQNAIIDRSNEEKDIDKIYEFTDSPDSNDIMKDEMLSERKMNKKLPKRNVSPAKLLADDNSDSVLNAAASDSFSIPTTPDFHESSADSKAKPTKTDKIAALDKTNYCEICNKSFIRIENLIKHKRTLTHIQKLSEIEAKEAAKKSKLGDTLNESSKTSDSIIEITSDSSKVTLDSSKTDINISDILHESNKPSDVHSPIVHSSFANNHSLKLADIINDVLNKPVLEGDNEKHNSFSDIIMQNSTDLQPEYRRYKSLGERKSFDSEPTEPQPVAMTEPYISKTTILEKQISLLENIIENQTGVNYIDDISMSSNNSLENDVLGTTSARESPSEISLKQDDSSNVTYTRNNPLKPSADDSFLKPSQYEEISEDSINQRNYEDQKLRKTLNRDEELFLECCSLLKSGSEVSSYSNKKSQNKVLSTMGLKQCDEPEWLERKSLVKKPLYEVVPDYSDDNSRIPTPLGDSYDDDASNSNTISSNWNMNKKVPVFEDISQEKQEPANQSFTFEEVLNEYEEHESKNKNTISKFGGILSKTINNQINAVHKMIRTPLVTKNYELDGLKKKQEDLSDGSTGDNKKVITKGARKVFEGLKVSIPTEELNLEEVLNCSPKSKKLEIANIQSFVENAKLTEEAPSSQNKPSRTARKSKPVKNKSQFGSNLLFKMNKKKVLSPTSTKKKDGDIKTHDVYDFEETQDNTDVFTKPDFRTFRSMKSNEIAPEQESDTESRDYLDSFSVGAQSVASSVSSSSSKKPKTQENITKKKCMIMGRIFKNAAKSKMEDIDEEIRDIPVVDNSELIESYVANCKKVIKNEEVAKPKLSENEINELFDQLLENKLNNLDTVHSELRTTVKSKPDIKKIDNKKKLKAKSKKRPRPNSESTDDEFSLNKTTKKRAYRKNAKAEDNCINLEQELKECIGVASRKSQRKCTSGKQNVLVEYWSSDDSQFEALLESQRIEAKQVAEQDYCLVENDLVPLPLEAPPVEDIPIEPPKPTVPKISEKLHKPKNADKKPQLKRKLSSERKPKTSGAGNGKNIDAITSNRRKRAAANPLYHWSSSSEDESQDLIEVKPIRDELEDDEDRPVQHGWIVGDSPKKLVTMLAQAKGKKTDIDCVKEQGKKRTNAVS